VTDERSDLAVFAVQTLFKLRGIAERMENAGHHRSDMDREVRQNIVAVGLAPAMRESLRMEMTRDEITRWL
jgi:uncharacterized membrane protein